MVGALILTGFSHDTRGICFVKPLERCEWLPFLLCVVLVLSAFADELHCVFSF